MSVFRRLCLPMAVAGLLASTGCNTPRLSSTGNPPSVAYQTLQSQAFNEALAKIAWPETITDKKVYIDVSGLEGYNDEYIRLAIQNQVFLKDLRPRFVEEAGDADFIIEGTVDVLGAENNDPFLGNPLIALITWPLFQIDVAADGASRIQLHVRTPDLDYVESLGAERRVRFRQVRFLLGLIGPFRLGSMERVRG